MVSEPTAAAQHPRKELHYEQCYHYRRARRPCPLDKGLRLRARHGGEIPFLGIADIKGRDITHTAKTLTEEGLRNSAAWIVLAGAVSLTMHASVGKAGIIRQDSAASPGFTDAPVVLN